MTLLRQAKFDGRRQYSDYELVTLAEATMADARFPCLATVDESGQPRVRPVSPVKTDGFTIYIANLRGYNKTAEIAAQPLVELCYLSKSHDQVRITGRAEIVDDADLLSAIWGSNPLLRKYLGTPDNPELIVYKVVPEQVRFMKEWALAYHHVPLSLPH
jgi:general stress protein 26